MIFSTKGKTNKLTNKKIRSTGKIRAFYIKSYTTIVNYNLSSTVIHTIIEKKLSLYKSQGILI